MDLENKMRMRPSILWLQRTYNTVGVQRRHAGDRTSLYTFSKEVHIGAIALEWENYRVGWDSGESRV
jgi:hypothetical protein